MKLLWTTSMMAIGLVVAALPVAAHGINHGRKAVHSARVWDNGGYVAYPAWWHGYGARGYFPADWCCGYESGAYPGYGYGMGSNSYDYGGYSRYGIWRRQRL